MKKNQLPGKVLTMLMSRGIKKEDILDVCPTDLSFDSQYANGYLFITKDYLGVVSSDPDINPVRYFKGTKEADIIYGVDNRNYKFILYRLESVEHMRIQRMIATNVITVVKNDEVIKIAALTNLYIEQMDLFVKSFRKLKHYPEEADEVESSLEAKEENADRCPKCGMIYPDQKRKICPNCMNKRSIFLRTFGYLWRYKWSVLMLFLCFILAAAVSLLWPVLSGTILYDKVLARNDAFLGQLGLAGKYGVAIFVLVVAIFLTNLIQRGIEILRLTIMAKTVARFVRDLKKDVFASLGRLSINFFVSKQTGTLMTRVLSDAERISNFFLDGFPYIFVHSFTIIASFVVMFKLNWQMALVTCILLPFLVFMSVKLKPKMWGLFGRRHRAERAVNSKVNDNLTGARVVKSFGQESLENKNFEAPNNRLRDAEVQIIKYDNKFRILYSFVQEISNIWVWILGVILLLNVRSLSLGVLITFVGYVAQLNGPMNFFSYVFHMWSDSINSAQRMYEIMDAISEVMEAKDPIRLPNPKGDIEIKDMSFGYEINKPILKQINLHVKPGEVLGIVGRSGAGKTTLVNLISRLYDPDEGNIYLDGHNIRDIAFNDLRRNVAMVSQDTYIFMGTVADNIAYGNSEASREDIINAAILASAHEFICNMPDGYDTVIGSSGKDLSGGEKQRISIARAVLANPKILILDEATASVDTETEKAIQQSLDILVKGRTTLSIAHRLSTLRDADRLIVIDNGKIVEEGTIEELTKLQGVYFKLMELQTKSLALKGLE